MEKTTSLELFYRDVLGSLPGGLMKKVGHFNVFRVEDYRGPKGNKPVPYSRKDYYKISLISGKHEVHYADKTLTAQHNMLLFANPQIPYNWIPLENDVTGVFCVFTEEFVGGFGNIRDYPLYRPGGMPVFDLTQDEMQLFKPLFDKMFLEIETEYVYKYDLLRNILFEIILTAMKLKPVRLNKAKNGSLANERIVSLFLELLERQFPIESSTQQIQLKTPSDYANQLNIHTNHLNKVLKEVTGQHTTAIISERIAQEARTLLKHTDWNISEIAWSLGFTDHSHFIKVFKKSTQLTPRIYRK
ncbi:helix-turn-helix domain-containing protein [Chryseobacterium tongliaoense]|uniref:helix-turn-helix domain-containing protein n=1 Tax=Chryseobacterium tongliaoense TaxID=3240933 RepID=UPI003515A765